MRKILLVEDDSSLGETLRERLSQDYKVDWATSKKNAFEILQKSEPFDLLILDVGLPDGTGFEIAQSIRYRTPTPTFIFLTAQSGAESRLQGYELGAEEFIPKPFHLKELLMRVKHVLDSHAPQKEIELAEGTVNFSTMRIQKKDGTIEYPSTTDLKVLQLLFENSPKPVTRDEILDAVWGIDKNPNHRSVDNAIVRLKKSLGESSEKHLRSVRGVGYQWIKDSEESSDE